MYVDCNLVCSVCKSIEQKSNTGTWILTATWYVVSGKTGRPPLSQTTDRLDWLCDKYDWKCLWRCWLLSCACERLKTKQQPVKGSDPVSGYVTNMTGNVCEDVDCCPVHEKGCRRSSSLWKGLILYRTRDESPHRLILLIYLTHDQSIGL